MFPLVQHRQYRIRTFPSLVLSGKLIFRKSERSGTKRTFDDPPRSHRPQNQVNSSTLVLIQRYELLLEVGPARDGGCGEVRTPRGDGLLLGQGEGVERCENFDGGGEEIG